MRIGAARHRDALALEVGDGLDRAVPHGDQRRPFGARIDVDRLDRIAVDLADQRGGAGGRAEIERAGVEELQRLVGAGDCTQRMAILSLANSCSSRPCSFSTRLTGL